MWFVLNFFSIPELFRTLFAPWTRIHEEYQKGDGVGEFFSDLFVNFIMRIVGFCVRIVTVVIGLVFLLVCFLGGVVFCIIWFLMPLVLVVILGYFIKFLA
jgi:fatty-acid desaturase